MSTMLMWLARQRQKTRALSVAMVAVLVLTGLLAQTASAFPVAPAAAGRIAANLFAPPSSTQFDMTGFLQRATLGGPGTGAGTGAHQGGTLMVNNHVVTVPSETIVILPANALTWQELFAQAPAPYGLGTNPPSTGLAMADVPAPLTTYEVQVVGNRVGDTYIAGLIYLSQQGLNSGAGYINFINYTTGEMRVGGVIGNANSGARVQLNDPTGRYGRAMSPDPRFTVDADNPTIVAGTGFPMCLPRTDPAVADDALCPQGNRPLDGAGVPLMSVQMNDPVNLPGVFPDATKQAPLEVGDYIDYAGNLFSDANGTYIAAHTITNNTAIYTWPGTNPAYVMTNVALIGTGGLTVLGAGEAVIRTRFEGMSTDPSRKVHLYGMDINPLTGAVTDRDWGTIGVDPGAAAGGAVKGRWRFRPPCLPFGSNPAKPDKQCVGNASGTFLPPTREMRAVVEGSWVPGQTTTYANGIIAGQYHAPILEYIFPENVPGTAIVENNFNTIDFLAHGGYTSAAGTLVGQLDPWPSNIIPAAACTAPVASAGGPYTVASGGTVTLAGSASGTAPFTFAWAAPAQGTLSDATLAGPVFTAPLVAAQTAIPLSLTVTNACGSSTANATVTVNAAAQPTVNQVASVSVFSGAVAQTIALSGSDPGNLGLTFNVAQAGAPALTNTSVTANGASAATFRFNAPVLPIGQIAPSVVTLTITATNSAGVVSAPATATVTVKPIPDAILIGTAQYRTSKQRLDLTVTSNVVSANVILTLQPYLTTTGVMFDPSGLGATLTNQLNGTYLLTLVGAPEPAIPPAAPLQVKSNLGGASPFTALTNIRQ